MAACAIHGEAQDAAPDGADHVVEVVEAVVGIVLFAIPDLRIAAEEPVAIMRVVGDPVEFVAGDLFGEEGVVRLVLVERADHVVAVSPGIGAVEVVLEAVGVGVARNIEPVPAPTFAVVRRGEQPIDEAFPALGVIGRSGMRRFRPESAAGRSGRCMRGARASCGRLAAPP